MFYRFAGFKLAPCWLFGPKNRSKITDSSFSIFSLLFCLARSDLPHLKVINRW